MFRAHVCALIGFVVMLAAAQTQARELALSVDARVGGDSNIFRTENDPVRNRDETADGYFEFSPKVGVREITSISILYKVI